MDLALPVPSAATNECGPGSFRQRTSGSFAHRVPGSPAPDAPEDGRNNDERGRSLHGETGKERRRVAAVQPLQIAEQGGSERKGELADGDDPAHDPRKGVLGELLLND